MATSKKRLGTKAKQGKTPDPDKPEGTGDRDPVNGRWLPGNSANPAGRPRGWDFRRIVQEKAKELGLPVEQIIWEVFLAMREAATGGDVQAGKLVIDRLCETDAQKLEIDHSGEIKGSNGPTLPATDDLLKGIEKLRDLANEHFGEKQ
jgi:hypothetical protein